MSAPITFVVPGHAAAVTPALPATPKAAVRVAARRAGADSARLVAVPGQDAVVLHIAGGPALVLHPENARDLLRAQGAAARSARIVEPDTVDVDPRLTWQGLEQAAPTRGSGFLGQVLVTMVELVTGIGADGVADATAAAIAERLDAQVSPGVHALRADALSALKGATPAPPRSIAPGDGAPLLVLLHGTFVDGASTFGTLWNQHPERVRELFRHHGDRVYSLEHPTLTASPVANALLLARALGDGCRLQLLTHSRGGLVAEVLARVAADPAAALRDFDTLAADAEWGDAGTLLRAEIAALAAELGGRGIVVERIVRAACPARGTLLASRRLDAYLSVLKWGLELAGVPVAPALLGFLTAVAAKREDWTLLPGLAAMLPENPLVQWLNAADAPIPGELRVIAGDLEGDSVASWVKTLLTDAFYWADHDLVVQTRSMYGGAPRAGSAAGFVLDRGGKVSHFNYFANARSVDAVVAGLTQRQPNAFRPIGPLSWAGDDSSGLRAARKPALTPGALPAVFVLPGILGSNLAVKGKRIWLGLRLLGGLSKLRLDPDGDDGVRPDGPIALSYGDLIDYLSDTHEVIAFDYDWRRPIEQEARRLADAVARALDARAANGLPVRLLAHSMGGLVARTMQLERPDVWQRLIARDGGRLLMLGTPNAGSWAPMQVLSGDDTFGNALVAFGSPLKNRDARAMMAAFPGFIQLQASLLDGSLADSATWQKLATQDEVLLREHNWWHGDAALAAYTWGVPPQAVLDQAVALRRRLDAQRDGAFAAFADRVLLVVGRARYTPDGYAWTDEGLVYLNAADGGDGRVVQTSALLPGVRTWRLDAAHGSLADTESAFPALLELLVGGDTDRLDRIAVPGLRGAAAGATATQPIVHVRSRPSRARLAGSVPPDSAADVFDAGAGIEPAASAARTAALRVTVLNGNLSFVRQPLIVGHYASLLLEGTERAVDRLVGGALSESLRVGLYPNKLGEQQIFVNPGPLADAGSLVPRPECAIVVGLGPEGGLQPSELAGAVRQGVLAWAGRLAEGTAAPAAGFEIAATLLGSGGIGVSPGAAARAITQGVHDANRLIERTRVGWPVVTHLTLVELFLERASDAWRELQVQAVAKPDMLDLAPIIEDGTGPLRRQVDTAYRGAGYDFIRAASPVAGRIEFTLDSHRARTEVRAHSTQGRLIAEMVARASNDANDDPQIGRTLFQLLVPEELEPFLGGTTRMLLELDAGTAGIPWEVLDTPLDQREGGDPLPWAIRSRLLRKLRTQTYRERVTDAGADDAVLVIGEPACNLDRYPRLPGARAEARAVAELFRKPGGIDAGHVTEIVADDDGGHDATTIINALLATRYRIVHISGHGEPGGAGGVVLSGDTVLGANEIASMRTVPELVFVNCCHLAARDPGDVLAGTPPINRSVFAATVADALISIGVRCVIAAGWAVDDRAAQVFATTLYRALLGGRPFIDAVAQAREAAWGGGERGNTWAAYQCYGDPNWVYRRAGGDAQRASPATSAVDRYANISSSLGLAFALEELAVESRYDFLGQGNDERREKLRHLEARFGAVWGAMGAIAEAYGVAWMDAGDFDRALGWYRRAVAANDGSATQKASEQLGNLLARRGWEAIAQALADGDPTAPLLDAARRDTDEALRLLQALAALQPTIERLSLCGSAWKRRVLIERVAQVDPAVPGDLNPRGGRSARARTRGQSNGRRAETAALRQMRDAYAQAEALAAQQRHPKLYYPGANRLAAELALHGRQAGWKGFDAAAVARIRASLDAQMAHDPNFWAAAGLIELDLVLAVAAGSDAERGLAAQLGTLQGRCNELRSRVPGRRFWTSVADQAEFVLDHVGSNGRRSALRRAAAELLAALRHHAGRDDTTP